MKSFILVLATVFLGLGASMERAQSGTHTLTCGPEKTIGQAIKTLKPGDTLLVSGTCNENLAIGQEVDRITLDGQGTATINGDSSANAVTVTGTGNHDTRIRHHRRRTAGHQRHGRRVRGD